MARVVASLAPERGGKPIGGYIFAIDNQVGQWHHALAEIVDRHTPEFCFDRIPVGAGYCIEPRDCVPNPETPRASETPLNVGTITVASTFDSLQLLWADGKYVTPAGSGPFWRGDGDVITISYPGRDAIPPFHTVVPAPVADATTTLPSGVVGRSSPLPLSWSYAKGGNRETVMLVSITQGDTDLDCIVPIEAHNVTLPSSLLTRFRPGPAFMHFSTNNTKIYDPVVDGNTRLSISTQGVVDMGVDDSAADNITFE